MRGLIYVFGVTVSLLAAAGSAQAVVLGQAGADLSCAYNMLLVQNPGLGPSYVVPGAGTITSWSIAGGSGGATEALVILRSTGGSNYTVVGAVPAQTVAPNVTATFPVSFAVQAGDLIGEWTVGGPDCALIFPGATLNFSTAPAALPITGDPVVIASLYNGGVLNMSAVFSAGNVIVPTLQDWGLVTLALLLLGLGLYVQRGRREGRVQ